MSVLSLSTNSPLNNVQTGKKSSEYFVLQFPIRSFVSSSRQVRTTFPDSYVSILVSFRVNRSLAGSGLWIANSWAWMIVLFGFTEKYPWWYHMDGNATYSPTLFNDTEWWMWSHFACDQWLGKHGPSQSGANTSPLLSILGGNGLMGCDSACAVASVE